MNRIIFILLLCASPQAFGQFWQHKTTSAKSDTSDANFIRPSDWNAFIQPFPDSSTFVSDDFLAGGVSSGNIGELGWQVATGTYFKIRGVADHPGVDSLQSPTSASTSVPRIALGEVGSGGLIMPTEFFDMTFIVKSCQTNDTTVIRMGLKNGGSSGNNAQYSQGIWIEKDSNETSWFGEMKASGQTRTAALGSVSTNWVKFRIRRIEYGVVGVKTDDSIGFTMDNGTELKLLASGANFPTTSMAAYVMVANNNKAVTRAILIDYFGLRTWPITR